MIDYDDVLTTDGLTVLANRGRVMKDGQRVHLTAHEFKILRYLMHRRNRIVSREELSEVIYDLDFERESNSLDVMIHRVRRKLGREAITTVKGLGFIHEDQAQ